MSVRDCLNLGEVSIHLAKCESNFQAGYTGITHTSQPHLGGKIQNRAKKEIEFKGGKTQ